MTILKIAGDGIEDNAITNAHLNSSAAIGMSKLALSITNSEVNASAAIAGTKIDPDFGSQGITTTGVISMGNGLTLTGTNPFIDIIDSNNNSDFTVKNDNGTFEIEDKTNSNAVRLAIDSSGTTTIAQNLDVGAGLDVTGNITVTGTVDGVDIAARNTLFGGLTSSSGVLSNGVTATTQSAGDNSTKVATTAYTDTAISNLVDSSPSALNTLNELAAALGDDASFSTTVTNSIATKLPLAGGTLTGNVIHNDNVQAIFGTGSDLSISHTGTNSYITNTTGTLFTLSNIFEVKGGNGNETHLKTTNDAGVELYYNNSKKLETTSSGVTVTGTITPTGNITFADSSAGGNNRLVFGAGADLQIWHDGSNSRIADEGTGELRLDSNSLRIRNAAGTETSAVFVQDGACELRYDHVKKFETTSSGISVTGSINATGQVKINDSYAYIAGTGNDLQLYHDGSNSFIINATGQLQIRSDQLGITPDDGSEYMFFADKDGEVELYYDGSKKLETTSGGVSVTGNVDCDGIRMLDSDEIRLGTGDDLKIYHDGNNSKISHVGTGGLYIGADTFALQTGGHGENYISMTANGAVELYYDNSVKLTTTSAGVDINGNLNLDDNEYALFGSSNDLQIHHDGGHSYIHQDGTGTLYILADTFRVNNEANSENLITGDANGSVGLYYDNSKKFETTSYGNLSAAQVRVASSNATTVGFSVGDVGTGFYNSGSNAIGYSANGTQKWNINSAGDLNLADNVKGIFGDGLDLQIHSDGTNGVIRQNNNSGALYLQADNFVQIGKVNAGTPIYAKFINGGAVELYYDNSKKFDTVSGGARIFGYLSMQGSGGHIYLPDSAELKIGNSEDLRIYHNGSHTWINDSGTGSLKVLTNKLELLNAANNEYMAVATQDAAVELYYNGSKKFETTAIGVTISGDLKLPDGEELRLGDGNDIQFYHDGTHSYLENNTGNLRIRNNGTVKTAQFEVDQIDFNDSANSEVRVRINSDGLSLLQDNDKIRLGASQDLQIYHDGTSSYIKDTAGSTFSIAATESIAIKTNNTEFAIACNKNGSVELYHDNSKKLETHSTGLNFQGGVSNVSVNLKTSNGTTRGSLYANTSNQIGLLDSGGDWAIVHTNDTSTEFYVQATKKATIDADGVDVQGNIKLAASNNAPKITFDENGADDPKAEIQMDQTDGSNASLIFKTEGGGTLSTRMTLASDGNVGIGKSSSSLDVDGSIFTTSGQNFQIVKSGSGGKILTLNRRTNVGLSIEFYRGSSVGSISHNNTSTAYNTTSDYRLKENVVSLSDAITRLKTLKPYRFNFISDKDTTVDGFLAHEVTAVPEAVTGTKDAVITQEMIDNEDYEKERLGEILPQGIDQAKLVPLLVAAVQEAIGKIEVLETEVAALKAS